MSFVPGHYPGFEGTRLWIFFSKGNYAANAQPVRAGDCTWLDRPMRQSEGAKMIVEVAGAYFHPKIRADGRVIGQGYSWGTGGQAKADQLKYLIRAIGGAQPFLVHGYGEVGADGPQIRITRIGP
jgi:hypothetical protein